MQKELSREFINELIDIFGECLKEGMDTCVINVGRNEDSSMELRAQISFGLVPTTKITSEEVSEPAESVEAEVADDTATVEEMPVEEAHFPIDNYVPNEEAPITSPGGDN